MSTLDRLKDIIVLVACIDEDNVTPEANFADDLGFDSLDSVECVMAAEDEFGVMLDDEVLEKIVTVQDAVDAIDAALAAKGVPA